MDKSDPEMTKLYQREQLHRIIMAGRQGQIILGQTSAGDVYMRSKVSPFLERLTNREFEILNLLSQGYTNSAISQTLYVGVKTVEHHLNRVYRKLREYPNFNDYNRHMGVSMVRPYPGVIRALLTSDTGKMRFESWPCS